MPARELLCYAFLHVKYSVARPVLGQRKRQRVRGRDQPDLDLARDDRAGATGAQLRVTQGFARQAERGLGASPSIANDVFAHLY